jgi:SNF2 family DNA or RNA helicase
MTNIKHSLNLTTANRVFIIEPQWNPSVENQAVARAIRMNQTKSVLVTRYIIKATVEQVHYLTSICVAISDRM